MKTVLALVALLGLSMAPALADRTSWPQIASLEAGIICPPEPVGSAPAPGTLAGVTHIIAQEPTFVSKGRLVPAVLGVGFGVKAQAETTGGIEPVNMVLTHPAMGRDQVTSQNFTTRISGSDPSFTFYQFDYGYELVTGTWQFTAMSGDTVLYTVSFDVVDPRQVPGLADVCGYRDLLS